MMEIKMPLLSQRLKLLRSEKNVTQQNMAELLGKTSRHYQDIESGKINIPSLTLIKLADYFGVSLDYLVGRSEDRRML
ncbi:helix-turn-helix transcriptional regulator [Pseudoflavonifractor sp. 60]|uniref:helix-turn-helix domain-containing protein n=1 Tax=Pseudoflavonifractor sp. 60 TaxID=2304576 RepID=UPI001FABCA28|nr:helix-turn-helix transcriptional regulator [Pseudoflavonifractor sp. 60]